MAVVALEKLLTVKPLTAKALVPCSYGRGTRRGKGRGGGGRHVGMWNGSICSARFRSSAAASSRARSACRGARTAAVMKPRTDNDHEVCARASVDAAGAGGRRAEGAWRTP